MTDSTAIPLVSIVWYGRNRLRHLEAEISSIRKQGLTNWQLVAEDGASTDGTLAWLERLASEDRRVEVISRPHRGAGEALLKALRRCTGKYIAICPPSGEFLSDAFEFAVGALDKSPDSGVLACRGLLVDAAGRPAVVPYDLVMALFTHLRLALPSSLIRREALVESGLMRDDWSMGSIELDLWRRLAMDHEILSSDRMIIGGPPRFSAGDFANDHLQLIGDRLRLVASFFDNENFFGDEEDLALLQEGLANQLGILREDFRGDLEPDATAMIEKLEREIAKKSAHILSYDQRAQRSMRRWRRMWRISPVLEVISCISRGRPPDIVTAMLLFFAVHWQSVGAKLFRAALPKRSRALAQPELAKLPAAFADLYAMQAVRYNTHGQVATALANWRLAEPLGDAMVDCVAVQAAVKLPGATEASVAEVHKRWVARHMGDAPQIDPRGMPRWDGKRRIRIGYHCSFMHLDTIRYMMARVLKAHDRKQFEVYGYSPYPLPSDIAEGFDVVRDTSTSETDPDRVIFHKAPMLSHAAFRRMVIDDRIDVFVEMTGISPGHRFPAMAARCAPVQISFLNHTASCQVPNVDYILADEICLPAAGGFERHYSEQIYRLPGCFFCFDYRGSEYPPIDDPPSLSTGHITFGCFGFGGKLNLRQIEIWAELLRQIPGSRLRLQNVQMANARSRRFLEQKFGRYGIPPERLVLALGTERKSLLKVYSQIDISLDTWPYNGGNTIAESLWHGVPVITLQGDRFASRYGASLLTAAGCADLVAHSPEQFIALAQCLASDPARLKSLRHHLRAMSIEHGLGDSVRFARTLEAAYVDMLSRLAH